MNDAPNNAVRNAPHWNVLLPINKRDVLDSGYPCTPEGAARCETAVNELLNLGYTVSVQTLVTIEHELPDYVPEYDCSGDFLSMRFCVIVHL